MSKLNTILVVDDAPENIQVLQEILKEDYKVKAATSGEKALELIKKDQPDLILLDVMMPGMDGHEVCQFLKSQKETQDIPIIFVTAMSDQKDEAHGIALGAVDYISKPISPAVVMQRVKLQLSLREAHKRVKLLNSKFSSYISPELKSSIETGETQAIVSNQRKKLSIFFSDIVGFTSSTEKLEPEDMTYLLNSYFESMTKIISKWGGTLDKYIGDAIMVFFGDPKTYGVQEDAINCVSMALEMQNKLSELRDDWKRQGISNPLRVRMGITTGYVTVGNFGSQHQLDYTIIGSPVNLAARLESNAPIGSVLISKETWSLVNENFNFLARGKMDVKGVSQAVEAFEVLADQETKSTLSWIDTAGQLQLDLSKLDEKQLENLQEIIEKAKANIINNA